MKTTFNQKVVIIGLDGADFKFINPLIKKGQLPNLKKLTKDGYHAFLKSTIPNYTAIAWSSMLTGKNPGKHGVMDIINWIRFNKSFINVPTHITGFKEAPFWQYANDQGKKSIIFNVPMTYPPKKINGCLITGFDTPSEVKDNIYPAKIKKYLSRDLKKFFYFQSQLLLKRFETGASKKDFTNYLKKTARIQSKIFRKLLRKEDWDIAMTVLQITDLANHFTNYNQDKSCLDLAYKLADNFIGEIIDSLPKNSLKIIISDHGSKTTKYKVNISKILEDQGLISFRNREVEDGIIKKIILKSIIENPIISKKINIKIFEKLWYRKTTRGIIKSLIIRLNPGLKKNFQAINWKNSRVYLLTAIGPLYLNKKTKENPHGIVSKEQQKKLIKKTINCLKKIKDTGGKKIFKQIFTKNQLWYGKYLKKDTVPDLIFQLNPEFKAVFSLPSGKLIEFTSKYEAGEHDTQGILIINKKINRKHRTPRLIDIAPTALAALGCEINKDIDGKVLANYRSKINRSDKILSSKNKIKFSKKDINEIKSRLETLGYLE